MNTIRRLIRQEPRVDLDKHDEILRDMENLTREIYTRIPVSDMVRGRWSVGDDQYREQERDDRRKP